MKPFALILAACPLAFAQVPVQVQQPYGQQALSLRMTPQPTSFDCAVDGSVVNSRTGEPIARAHVTLQSQQGTPSFTNTDASGKWAFSNVACVSAPVLVTRPGFLQQARTATNMTSGSPMHDVKIELIPQSVFYGKVTDEQGDPVQGAEVFVFVQTVTEGRATFQRRNVGSTNDLGEYRIASLPRGKYIVCADSNSGPLRDENLAGAQTCYPGPLDGGSASAMDLPAGRETRMDFTLREAPTVHVRGTVNGLPEGRSIGISLVPRGPAVSMVTRGGGNGRNGKFDFRVPAGSYMISADYFEQGKHLIARVPIEVGATDIDDIAVTLDPGFKLTGLARIDSQSGQTIAPRQFGINLRATEPSTGVGQLKWDADRTNFAFNDMSPGTYRLDVFPPPPFYVKSATLGGQDILNSEFTVTAAAGPIEIVLSDDGGSIEGDVVNADGQPPSAGGVIALCNGRAGIIPTTGHFKLQNLAPGDYTVYAWDNPNQVPYADQDWMSRYASDGVSVTVSAGQNSQVKLTQQTVPE